MYFEVLLDKFLVDMLPQVKIEYRLKLFKLLRLILKILPVSLALILMIIVAMLRIINLNLILTYNRYMKTLK